MSDCLPTEYPDYFVPALRAGQVKPSQTGRVRPVDLEIRVGEEEADHVSVATSHSQVEQGLSALSDIRVTPGLLEETHHRPGVSLPARCEDWLAHNTFRPQVSNMRCKNHLLHQVWLPRSMSNTATITSGDLYCEPRYRFSISYLRVSNLFSN